MENNTKYRIQTMFAGEGGFTNVGFERYLKKARDFKSALISQYEQCGIKNYVIRIVNSKGTS